MHGLPRVPISYGAPSWVLSGLLNTPFFKWIYENHMGHHVLGGQVRVASRGVRARSGSCCVSRRV